MATVTENSDDCVRRLNRESTQLEAETRRLRAEADKLLAERMRQAARGTWMDRLLGRPLLFMAFCLILTVTVMALGASLVLVPKFLS
jgi:hypothetical protein